MSHNWNLNLVPVVTLHTHILSLSLSLSASVFKAFPILYINVLLFCHFMFPSNPNLPCLFLLINVCKFQIAVLIFLCEHLNVILLLKSSGLVFFVKISTKYSNESDIYILISHTIEVQFHFCVHFMCTYTLTGTELCISSISQAFHHCNPSWWFSVYFQITCFHYR